MVEQFNQLLAFFGITGSYRRALDEKLRLAIPKPLRERLPEDHRLYLTPGLDGCLAA